MKRRQSGRSAFSTGMAAETPEAQQQGKQEPLQLLDSRICDGVAEGHAHWIRADNQDLLSEQPSMMTPEIMRRLSDTSMFRDRMISPSANDFSNCSMISPIHPQTLSSMSSSGVPVGRSTPLDSSCDMSFSSREATHHTTDSAAVETSPNSGAALDPGAWKTIVAGVIEKPVKRRRRARTSGSGGLWSQLQFYVSKK